MMSLFRGIVEGAFIVVILKIYETLFTSFASPQSIPSSSKTRVFEDDGWE
jgi:hypothetical protein